MLIFYTKHAVYIFYTYIFFIKVRKHHKRNRHWQTPNILYSHLVLHNFPPEFKLKSKLCMWMCVLCFAVWLICVFIYSPVSQVGLSYKQHLDLNEITLNKVWGVHIQYENKGPIYLFCNMAVMLLDCPRHTDKSLMVAEQPLNTQLMYLIYLYKLLDSGWF